ncbi:recombinase family protein, partial [Patescibacteria group bacterium]|nr:recombinase family protein [Patescibacteria group bacterium]
RSGIYRIFTNPFYAGVLNYDGQEHQGSHERMVTLEEFDQVQMLLGRKGKPRPKKHHFAFTGLIRCAECGCLITAVEKHKHIKSTGQINSYTYYYCTRKKKQVDCSQKKVTKEEDLEKQCQSLEILNHFLVSVKERLINDFVKFNGVLSPVLV